MATHGFVLYLLSGFSAAVLLAVVLDKNNNKKFSSSFLISDRVLQLSSSEKVWPSLEFGWRIVAATVIGFLGSAFGTVGGVGGGGFFVPMLTLIVGFDIKSAAALSKCMVTAASAASIWYNLQVQHPTKDVPILDYDLALLFQPIILLGITLGVSLSIVFPYWLITALIIILFVGTSCRSFFKAISMWKEETVSKKELENQQQAMVNSRGELLVDTDYEPLNREEKTTMKIIRSNLNWKMVLLLLTVWILFLLLQILENAVSTCGAWYWIFKSLQCSVAFGMFGLEPVKFYRENKRRKENGNRESVCEASSQSCPLCSLWCHRWNSGWAIGIRQWIRRRSFAFGDWCYSSGRDIHIPIYLGFHLHFLGR